MDEPTIEERYKALRANAEAFVKSMQTMVAAAENGGDDDLAAKLRVWCLMPWQAAIRDDDSGDLWPQCEVCGKPIKDEGALVACDDAEIHRSCVEPGHTQYTAFRP